MGYDLIIHKKVGDKFIMEPPEFEDIIFDGRPSGRKEFVKILNDVCKNKEVIGSGHLYGDVYEEYYYRFNMLSDEYLKAKNLIRKIDNSEYFLNLLLAMDEDPSIYLYDSY